MNPKTTKVITEQSDLEVVCNKIKRLLKEKGLTYESFAKEYFHKTEGWFSHIMNKKRRFTVDVLFEIAEKLDVDPASLLPGKDSPKTLDDYIDLRVDKKLEELKQFMEKLINKKLTKNK